VLRVRDARTLVTESAAGPRGPLSARWGTAWTGVEREVFSVGLDNRDGHWSKAVGVRLGAEVVPAGATLLANARHVAVSVRADEFAGGRFVADAADDAAAKAIVDSVEAVGTFGRTATAMALKGNPDDRQRRWLRLAADVFERRPVRHDGTTVQVDGVSRVELAKLVKDFLEVKPADELNK
jgi:hypothetical protein